LHRTVTEELEKLRDLKEQSRFRKFTIQEDDKKQIAEISSASTRPGCG